MHKNGFCSKNRPNPRFQPGKTIDKPHPQRYNIERENNCSPAESSKKAVNLEPMKRSRSLI